AAATARALAACPPDAVLHVGLAGARQGCGIEIGAVVVGAGAVYEDLETTTPVAPAVAPADPGLVETTARVVGMDPVRIGTSARVGGTGECPVEAMEGFAVLRACALAGVPAVEVRAISNRIGDARGDWRIGEALEALDTVLPRLLAAAASAVHRN